MKILIAGLPVVALVVATALFPRSNAAASSPVCTQWNLTHTCTYCHLAHGGPNTANLKYADVEVLCLSCHGPGGISTRKALGHEDFTCVECHDKHLDVDNRTGGQNISMVGPRNTTTLLATIQTPDGPREVTFESRGLQAGQPTLHSFSDDDQDGDGVYDGACEVCHVSIDGSHWEVDNHNFGQTCTSCHLHSRGFEEP